MDLTIKEATINDLEEVLKLNKALFEYETKFNIQYNLGWTFSDIGKNYFQQLIAGEKGFVLVAQIDNKVVGYIAISIYNLFFRKQNPLAELDNMFVLAEYRSKGVGKRLVEEAKKQAKAKGAKRLKVETAAQNEQAINFYKSNGFADFDVILEMNL